MDVLDFGLGSLTITDQLHHLLQSKIDPTSTLPSYIPNNTDGVPLTPEEEEWYEFIALTTRVEEWSQRRLEECWLPYDCEFCLYVLGTREGRIMWGLLVAWYISQGWLEHYRTIWPRDVIKMATAAAAASATTAETDPAVVESLQDMNWMVMTSDLDAVEVKVYRLSQVGRQELMDVLRLKLIQRGDGRQVGSHEKDLVMKRLKTLELGPPADVQL